MSEPAVTQEAPILPAVDDVAEVAANVWSCYVDDSIPLMVGFTAPDAGPVAVVRIDGAWHGSVALCLSNTSADAVTAQMVQQLGLQGITTEEVLAELVNMIGGNIKGLLPDPSALSIPEVNHLPTPAMEPGNGLDLDLDWLGHPVRVTVRAAA